MDWIKSLNKAIGYIEDHLLTDLSYEEISGHLYVSSYHFQRAFSLLTGMSVGEYIRNRRLSLAGHELIVSNIKVIDVALKYGYETPESFTKAFCRFHGITPSQAKSRSSDLKSFDRLLIKIILEGGYAMDYSLQTKEAFEVLAMTREFEQETSNTELPKFWTEFYKKGYGKYVKGMFGICSESKEGTSRFNYSIADPFKDNAAIPEGFEIMKIPSFTWAVFKCMGPMPGAIQDMMARIYSEWLPSADYDIISDYDIEMYTAGDNQSPDYETEIWIPVIRK